MTAIIVAAVSVFPEFNPIICFSQCVLHRRPCHSDALSPERQYVLVPYAIKVEVTVLESVILLIPPVHVYRKKCRRYIAASAALFYTLYPVYPHADPTGMPYA